MIDTAPPVVIKRPRTPRDIVVEPELLRLLGSHSPLTVVRGPRGFGKTTLVGAWLDALPAEEEVVYLRLTRACNDAAVFWQGLADGLHAAGAIDPTSGDHRAEVVRLLPPGRGR